MRYRDRAVDRAGVCLKCAHTWRALTFPERCSLCGAGSRWLIGAAEPFYRIEAILKQLGRDPRVVARNRDARESAATGPVTRRSNASISRGGDSRASVFR